ncbi:hypothetical protein DSO57_1006504 [Entomophthora muscae]|uniref:Uncharacterized protein n=1 Tax=Entomophthora muscae TaxID=34485 RepID=A0ACC2S9G3_9FUNG|nr:hypothetical protein DSO57_1006504 [Entomophthora muscae]
MPSMESIIFKPCKEPEAASEIEQLGYPADEAASLEALQCRYELAPELFYGAYGEGELIGFVSATKSASDALDHQSMSSHNPAGSLICLHSVCVHPTYQRCGVATQLMTQFIEYVTRMKNEGMPLKKIAIISHDHLLGWYQKLGFTLLGPSSVAHGSTPWFDLEYELESF